MRNMLFMFGFIFLTMLFFSAGIFAQNRNGRMMNMHKRLFDVNTVQTIKGEVINIETITGKRGPSGVHLTLKTAEGEIPVHLGPQWFLYKQSVKIEKGDQIEVTGSKITYEDNPAIIAQEVKKGNEVLTLRDKSGIPIWRGERMQAKQ